MHVDGGYWATIHKTRDMYIRRRRVPTAETRPVNDGQGPDGSLKRPLISIWTHVWHCVALGTVTR